MSALDNPRVHEDLLGFYVDTSTVPVFIRPAAQGWWQLHQHMKPVMEDSGERVRLFESVEKAAGWVLENFQ